MVCNAESSWLRGFLVSYLECNIKHVWKFTALWLLREILKDVTYNSFKQESNVIGFSFANKRFSFLFLEIWLPFFLYSFMINIYSAY